MKTVFVSPHNDDETLFGAFTLQEYAEGIEVVVVFDSFVQVARGYSASTAANRRNETLQAVSVFGIDASRVNFLGLRDDQPVESFHVADALSSTYKDYKIFAPAYEVGGNKHHNVVASAISLLGVEMVRYLTYTDQGKSTLGERVPIKYGNWIRKKLMALACYRSQYMVDDCLPHFLRPQEEYRLA